VSENVSLPHKRPRGVCAAALTPLTADLAPDTKAVVVHVRRLLATGCDAINLLGTTGEASSFSVRQRLSVMEAVAAAGLPLDVFMVGTGAPSLDDTLVLTRAAIELGYAGQLVIPPYYFKGITDEGIVRYYATLIERIADPRFRLYLYHFPQLSSVGFSPAVVARIAAAYPATLVGLKDSSGVSGYPESIVAVAPAIDVFPSSEALLSVCRTRGFAGVISATLNVTAPLAGRVWAQSAAGPEAAAELQGALTAIRAAIAQHQLVPALRAVIAAMLGDDAWLRVLPPLVEIDPVSSAALLAKLAAIPHFNELGATNACA
jgi:4-hydroxy-tetrahydrodipicolinate synthase